MWEDNANFYMLILFLFNYNYLDLFFFLYTYSPLFFTNMAYIYHLPKWLSILTEAIINMWYSSKSVNKCSKFGPIKNKLFDLFLATTSHYYLNFELIYRWFSYCVYYINDAQRLGWQLLWSLHWREKVVITWPDGYE